MVLWMNEHLFLFTRMLQSSATLISYLLGLCEFYHDYSSSAPGKARALEVKNVLVFAGDYQCFQFATYFKFVISFITEFIMCLECKVSEAEHLKIILVTFKIFILLKFSQVHKRLVYIISKQTLAVVLLGQVAAMSCLLFSLLFSSASPWGISTSKASVELQKRIYTMMLHSCQ